MSDTAEGYRVSLDAQLERLEQVLKENPNDPSTLMAFGEMSLRRGRKLVALLAFQRVEDMKPDVLEVHLYLAKIYASQKMYLEAYGETLEALKLDKGSVEARILYDILVHESDPPEELVGEFKECFSEPYNAEEVGLYLQQLSIEKDRLSSDVRELSMLLESSPMDTILEYNKNMAARRLGVIEKLLQKAMNLDTLQLAGPAAGAPQSAVEPVAEPAVGAGEVSRDEEPIATVFPVVEPHEAPVEKEPPAPAELPPEEREQLIQAAREVLEPLIQNFKKTRGIVAVAAVHLNGGLVHVIQDDTTDFGELAWSLSRTLKRLSEFSSGLAYWVMEFQKGVLIAQSLVSGLFLCAVGDSTTGFGSLRFQMDKNRPSLLDALKQVDLSRLE